jgi:staphylococcal nuclease domain-containing protein 1
VQYSEQGAKVEQLQSELRDSFNQTKPVGGHAPKKGELLAARFTADNEWYRARVEKVEPNNRISVYFVDYGNREIITDPSRLTTLPPGKIIFAIKAMNECLVSSRLCSITSSSS